MVESSQIQEIADRLEIQDLLTSYCTAIDTKQFNDLGCVFTPDAFIDYTSAGGGKGRCLKSRNGSRKSWICFR